MTDHTDEELIAWEQYLTQQSKIPFMPGLTARPAFIAGLRAARQQDMARLARMREALEYADGFISDTDHTEFCAERNGPVFDKCDCGKHYVGGIIKQALSETADIQEWMDGQRAQWQPIETAPKDGTDILIFIEGSGEQFSAWHDNGSWWFAKTNNCGHILRDPTHWMPLPAAPSARSTKGEGK